MAASKLELLWKWYGPKVSNIFFNFDPIFPQFFEKNGVTLHFWGYFLNF